MVLEEKKIYDFCEKNFDVANGRLSDEYYYNNLPLCIIDSVFSTGQKYTAVKNLVNHFCDYTKELKFSNIVGNRDDKYKVNDFIKCVEGFNDKGADLVFNNRKRAYSYKGAPLKSELCYKFAKVLEKYKVNDFSSLNNVKTTPVFTNIKNEINSIPGLKSGIVFDYSLMLSGDDNYLKLDRMVKRFVKEVIGYEPTPNEITTMLTNVCEELKKKYPSLTLRLLDHIIWQYETDKSRNNKTKKTSK